MAEVQGAQTILARALPTGVDGARLTQWQLRDGVTWAQLIGRTAQALGQFNNDLMQKWGWLMFSTEEPYFEYPNGGSLTSARVITDLDKLDPISEGTIAHQLQLLPVGDAIGGTYFWMRDARSAQITAQINGVVNRIREKFEEDLLTRWLTNTENNFATSAYDVPFVRGAGGSVDFVPPAHGGETFSSAHDHYMGIDSDSYGYDDFLNQMAETLQEHGHEAPYTAMVSRSDISSYYALPDFVEPLDRRVVIVDRAAADTEGAGFFSRQPREFGIVGGFQSEYGYIELRATARIPTKYAGLAKSYGQNNMRNPLAVRVHPDEGFGAKVLTYTRADDTVPIKKLDVVMEYGVGVGMDRTNGVAGYLDSSGTWTNPTIS
jgi:hypothetical protein